MAYIDENGLLYYHGKVKQLLNGKVDSVSGKGLSTNDYTDADQLKLSGIESGAEANIIESVSVNGTAQTITSKGVNITVPTKTSDISNDSNYVADANYVHTDNNFSSSEKTKLSGIATGAEVNVLESVTVNGTAATITNKGISLTIPTNNNQLSNGAGYQTASDVSSAISTALEGVTGFSFEVVQSLPASGETGVIYLVSHSHGTNDGYDEYIWLGSAYEKLGHADVDLSGYLQTSSTITNAQIDTILAS